MMGRKKKEICPLCESKNIGVKKPYYGEDSDDMPELRKRGFCWCKECGIMFQPRKDRKIEAEYET